MTSNFDNFVAKEKAKKRRKPQTYEEDRLNINCVRYFDIQYRQYWSLLNHSPNEGKRSEMQGALLKQKGMRAGFPDLVLMMPVGNWRFLAMELKTPKGRQSPSERFWQEQCEKNGGYYTIIRTIEDFKTLIDEWIRKARLWEKVTEEISLYGYKFRDGKSLSEVFKGEEAIPPRTGQRGNPVATNKTKGQ